jgi:hypothetical protein
MAFLVDPLDWGPERGRLKKRDFNLSMHGRETMFTFIRDYGLMQLVRREAIPFSTAFVVAELAYKFKSFALECIAFLLTWYVLSFIQSVLFDRKQG